MVRIGAVSYLLPLAVPAVAGLSDTQLKAPLLAKKEMMNERNIQWHSKTRNSKLESELDLGAQTTIHDIPPRSKSSQAQLGPAVLRDEPQVSVHRRKAELDHPLARRQNDGMGEGTAEVAAAAVPAPATDPAQTTLGPIASSVSAALTSSAASALASVSASFQGQLGALSSQSSADIAAVSSYASSTIAAITASAASAIASVSASASSAIDLANGSVASLVARASSAGAAAASSSVAASAMSVIAAVEASAASEVSGTTPSATANVNNNIVQPNSSGSSDDTGAVLVTPSQIAAIVIGTIVGTAIFTLLVVYSIVICRHRKEKKRREAYERENKYSDDVALSAIDHNDETGRAEGYSSRDEKQRANWSAQARPVVPAKQMSMPQKPQLISHRPSLPPLLEESPRVSDQSNPYPLGERPSSKFDFHAMSYTPEQSAPGMLEEPEPVKLALMKRTSQGGSQRLAVRRVGSVSQRGGGDTNANQRASVVNPYFSSPMSAGAPPFQRPALVRTPSSDTLPHSNGDFPSPLALNPPLGASTGPRVPAFTWGSWGPDAPVRASLLPDQYQNLNAQLQSDYPYTYRAPISQPHYSQERNQDHISLRLQRDDVSPRSAQEPSYNAESSHRSNTGARFTESGYLPPNPLNPKNNRAISPVSPYSSTFENPLASPSFMSPLSPPPKSPLRTVVRPSRSDYSLRERSVSPLSSDGGDSTDKPMPPLPLRRLSRSSGALGALNFAQATAGLDLSAGPGGALFTPTPPFLTCTDTNGTTFSGVVSRASSLRSSNTNTNPDGGGQFTFLASNGHTPESNRSVTPTSPWGPLPALKKRRSSSLGRIEILPEELTTGGIYVGAPGPRFTLFPRTDGGNESSIAAIAPMSPLGMGHSRSHSTGNVGLGVVDR